MSFIENKGKVQIQAAVSHKETQSEKPLKKSTSGNIVSQEWEPGAASLDVETNVRTGLRRPSGTLATNVFETACILLERAARQLAIAVVATMAATNRTGFQSHVEPILLSKNSKDVFVPEAAEEGPWRFLVTTKRMEI